MATQTMITDTVKRPPPSRILSRSHYAFNWLGVVELAAAFWALGVQVNECIAGIIPGAVVSLEIFHILTIVGHLIVSSLRVKHPLFLQNPILALGFANYNWLVKGKLFCSSIEHATGKQSLRLSQSQKNTMEGLFIGGLDAGVRAALSILRLIGLNGLKPSVILSCVTTFINFMKMALMQIHQVFGMRKRNPRDINRTVFAILIFACIGLTYLFPVAVAVGIWQLDNHLNAVMCPLYNSTL